MISHPNAQDIDLWEAWIEYDPFSPNYFGTLYVIGEIKACKKLVFPVLTKSTLNSAPEILILNIQQDKSLSRKRSTEVSYAEPIVNLNQYTSICIYSGDELIAEFTEIEVII